MEQSTVRSPPFALDPLTRLPSSYEAGCQETFGQAGRLDVGLRRARHIGCMVVFAGFGIATFGIGVFAVWSTAGGSMISHDIKKNKVLAHIAELEANFPRVREI